MKKRSKGVSGITVGLIAAIIFITIVLPLTVSYIVNTTNRFGAKSYGIEYQEYKILEEKGISACYTQLLNGDYIIRVNNTLGKPVIINLLYVKYKNNVETISTLNLRIEEKTVIPLGVHLEPGVIKLISSSGAVINVPPCSQIVATTTSTATETLTNTTTITITPSYTDIITYILTKRYPVNVYWDEKQYPQGIQPYTINIGIDNYYYYLGYILVHNSGLVIKNASSAIFVINGTLSPDKEWFKLYDYDVFKWILSLVGYKPNHAPSLILDNGPYNVRLFRTDAGDYVATVLELNSSNYCNITDNYGFLFTNGIRFEYPEVSKPVGTGISGQPYTIKKLLLNYVYKYADEDLGPNATTLKDPLKYILVNSGYDFLIVGVETSGFDPNDLGWDTFGYRVKLYIATGNVSAPQDNPDLIIDLEYSGEKQTKIYGHYYTFSIEHLNVTLGNGTNIGSLPIAYREYLKEYWTLQGVSVKPLLIDQIVFIVPQDLIGLEGGGNVSIYAEAMFIHNGELFYDFYGYQNPQEGFVKQRVSYVYMPVKTIIDSWVKEYFTG